MSLINQMLRDIKDRQEGSASPVAAPPVQRGERSRRLPQLLLLLGGGLGGVLLLWWLAGQVTTWFAPASEMAGAPATVSPAPVVAVQSAEHVPAKKRTTSLRPEVLPGGVSVLPERTGRGVYQTAEESFLAAQKFYREGRDSSVAAALQLCLEMDPQHFAAREFLADTYEMAGRFDEAVELLREGVALAPAHVVFKKRAAALLAEQGELSAAAQILLQAGLPTVGEAPDIHALLASYYLQLHEPFLAAQTYRNLLAVWPKSGAFWAGLGRSLDEQGLSVEARRAYLQALAAGDLPETVARFVEQRLQARR